MFDQNTPTWQDEPVHLKDFFDDEAFENRRFDRMESQEDYLEEETL